MKADPQEQLTPLKRRSRFPLVELLLALAITGGLVFYWFWDTSRERGEPIVSVLPQPIAETELPPTPDIPRQPATDSAPPTATDAPQDGEEVSAVDPAALAEPPPLTPGEGNQLLAEQLAAIGPVSGIDKLLANEHPLDMSAALVDGLGQGLILRKMLPLTPPGGAFAVSSTGGTIYMAPGSYQRYDVLADSVSSLDVSSLVGTFHTLRPLFEQAYERLGLDTQDFDNAVIRTLDLVLATPEIDEPIALKQKSVIYLFADPALESLPDLQKQLLRMGPDNVRRIKEQAGRIRDSLLAQ